MSKASDIVIRITGDSKSAVRALSTTEGAVGRFEGTLDRSTAAIGRWAKRAAIAFGAAGLAAGAAILKLGSDYEESLNKFEAVTQASAAEMTKLGQVAKDLGNDLSLPGTSAADAAQAMTELAKGGLSVADSMDAAKGALQLAIGAQVEEAQAAEIVANALNAFSLEGKEATRVADLLAAASTSASGEVTDMADSFKMGGSVFAATNQTIEDLAVSTALMAKNGIKGGEAGTTLKQMMLRLTAPTDQAKQALDELGVSVFNADGSMRSLRDLVGQFTKATAGLTDEQRSAALATIFGTRAINAANSVLTQGVENWDAMTDAVTREGAAADLAASKSKGLRGALDGIVSTLETAALTAYEFVAAPLTEFLRGVGVSLNMLADDPAWQRFSEQAKKAFQPVLDVISNVGLAMQEGGFRAGMEELRSSIQDALGGIDWGSVLERAFAGLQTSTEKVVEIATWFATTLTQALAQLDWATTTEQLTTAFIGMMLAIDFARLAAAGVEVFVKAVPAIIDGFIQGLITAATENPVDLLMLFLAIGFAPVKVIGAFAGVLGKIPLVGPIFSWLLRGFKTGADKVFGPAKTKLREIGEGILGGLLGGISAGWRAGPGKWLAGLKDLIPRAIGNLGGILKDIGKAIMGGLFRGLRSAWDTGKGWLGSLGGKIANLKGPLSTDKVLLQPAGTAIMDGLIRSMQAEEARLTALLRSITSQIGATSPVLGPLASSVPGMAAGAGMAGGVGTQVHIVVNAGSVVTPDELTDAIYRGLKERSRRQGGLDF